MANKKKQKSGGRKTKVKKEGPTSPNAAPTGIGGQAPAVDPMQCVDTSLDKTPSDGFFAPVHLDLHHRVLSHLLNDRTGAFSPKFGAHHLLFPLLAVSRYWRRTTAGYLFDECIQYDGPFDFVEKKACIGKKGKQWIQIQSSSYCPPQGPQLSDDPRNFIAEQDAGDQSAKLPPQRIDLASPSLLVEFAAPRGYASYSTQIWEDADGKQNCEIVMASEVTTSFWFDETKTPLDTSAAKERLSSWQWGKCPHDIRFGLKSAVPLPPNKQYLCDPPKIYPDWPTTPNPATTAHHDVGFNHDGYGEPPRWFISYKAYHGPEFAMEMMAPDSTEDEIEAFRAYLHEERAARIKRSFVGMIKSPVIMDVLCLKVPLLDLLRPECSEREVCQP